MIDKDKLFIDLIVMYESKLVYIKEKIHNLIHDGCSVDTKEDQDYVLDQIDSFFEEDPTNDR